MPNTEVMLRRPRDHIVISPNCSGYCDIPPDSAFRTKALILPAASSVDF